MPRVKYIEKSFRESSLTLIATANEIISDYSAQGYDLTLRQLYYQFVARDVIPNNQKSYKNLGSLINDARLAGLIDWNAIEDRTRSLRAQPHWDNPAQMIQACEEQFSLDKWEGQGYAPEVWIEKDALIGVISGVCDEFDVPYFSCRGYTSQSEQWRAGRRLKEYARQVKTPIIFHLGDHDPSGLDMTRDNAQRLSMFSGLPVEVKRLALNADQIQEYDPPPNPAKLTDSRSAEYVRLYGDDSWELDALEPSVLAGLISDAIMEIRDHGLYDEVCERQAEIRQQLKDVRVRFEEEGS